jgi:hypothetical protein
MRRHIGEWLLSVGSIALLLLALVVIYDPVPDDVARRVMSKPSAELSSVASRVGYQASRFTALGREQVRGHTELAIFAVAAVVLFGFMLRT